MKRIFLVFALAALLLLAGCVQMPGKSTGEKETGTQVGGQEEQQQGEQQTTGEQGAGEEQQETGEQQQEENQAAGEQQSYDEMAVAALMKLGVPIKCVVSYSDKEEGLSGTATHYVLGENIRSEMQTTEGQETIYITVITKEDGTYLKAEEETKTGPFENCDWLFYPKEEGTGTTETSGYEVDEESNFGAAYANTGYEYSYHCEPAMFGEEKFQTPGNVCNIMEIASNPCASIEDPEERAQCEAAYGG